MHQSLQFLGISFATNYQVQTLFIILLIVLCLILTGAVVLLSKRDKKWREDFFDLNKELKEEQLVSQLKDKELKTIKKLVLAQEKERLNVANDLNEDLRRHMGVLKKHFSLIKMEDRDRLYNKTDNLIEEAYLKIRHFAEAKNYGMMANKSLLKALKSMTKEIYDLCSINVSIHESGLNQRLENSMGLILFRVIQELIYNAILHAKVREVDVHLTKHENTLNVMVEDNGRGFDVSSIYQKSGFGLKSIERRIENLDGKMLIESRMGVGTTVIIDVPI